MQTINFRIEIEIVTSTIIRTEIKLGQPWDI